MGKLRLREIKELAQGHIGRRNGKAKMQIQGFQGLKSSQSAPLCTKL